MKTTINIYHVQYSWESTGRIDVSSVKFDDESNGSFLRFHLKEIEVDIGEVALLTEDQTKKAIVSGLEGLKNEIQAKCFVEIKQIDDRIQELQAIAYLGDGL